MYVPEIIEVKELFDSLKSSHLINSWELPYENLLTRRSAAIFFFEPLENDNQLEVVEERLLKFDDFSIRVNEERKLSVLKYRVTFSRDEKSKNQKVNSVQ